jgi:hypothetical protein
MAQENQTARVLAAERLLALGLQRFLKTRAISAPSIEALAGPPITVDARVTMPDGETITRLVAISPRTQAADIENEVRAAISLDPDMRRARVDKVTLRAARKVAR